MSQSNVLVLSILTRPFFVLLLTGILGTLAVAVHRENGAAMVNGLVVVFVVLLPVAVNTVIGVRTGTALSFWLGLAGLLHMIGMLGVYETVWWWDHVTHTVSAGLVAALYYSTFLATTAQPRIVVATLTVGLTFVAGVFWELIELIARAVGKRFEIDPVLIYYGWKDTSLDLAFDLFAAVGIVMLDLGLFVPLAAQSPEIANQLLVACTILFVFGSVAMAGALTVFDAWPWSQSE